MKPVRKRCLESRRLASYMTEALEKRLQLTATLSPISFTAPSPATGAQQMISWTLLSPSSPDSLTEELIARAQSPVKPNIRAMLVQGAHRGLDSVAATLRGLEAIITPPPRAPAPARGA